MSALIEENKWDINYIQTLPAQIEQKVLRKILEKIFITKVCVQCKTSHTLKTDVFELPDNKKIGKLFSQHGLLFLDQANFSSNPFQVLILQYPIPRAFPAFPAISFKLHPGQLKPLFNTILIVFFIRFPIFSYPIRTHAAIIECIKPYAKLSQSNILSRYI